MVRGTRRPWRKYIAVKLGHQIAIYHIPHTCDPIPTVKKSVYVCGDISEKDENNNCRYLVTVVVVVVAVVVRMRYEF